MSHAAAAEPARPRRPAKAVRVLARGHRLQVLDAAVRAVAAREVGLILDRRLAEAAAVALLSRRTAAGDRRVLSARVAHAGRLGPRRWLVRCRFDVPLSESELQPLLN
jgi:hypothetical protein